MGKIYQNHMEHLKDRFSVERLDVELNANPSAINLSSETKDSRLYKENMQRMKDKFGIDKIQLVSPLEQKIETTLAELVDEHEAEQVKRLKLCLGQTKYQGKKLNLWFAISKEM